MITDHKLHRLQTRLCEPDWFYLFGSGLRKTNDSNKILILGERKIHQLNFETMEFDNCFEHDECFSKEAETVPAQLN